MPREKEDYLGELWRTAADIEHAEASIEEGPRLFLGGLAFVIAAAAGFILTAWYFAAPRLAQFAPWLPKATLAVFGAGLLYLFTEYAGLAATALTGKNYLLPLGRHNKLWLRAAAAAIRSAPLLRSSRDRFIHSFVRVSNAVATARRKSYARKRGPILVLLPRCVQRPECPEAVTTNVNFCRRCCKCLIGEVLELRDEYDDVIVVVLAGGSAVRGLVRRLDPRAVIGVACERELWVGIAAMDDRPVVGIANQRPYGPCRATSFHVEELKRVLEEFRKLPNAPKTASAARYKTDATVRN